MMRVIMPAIIDKSGVEPLVVTPEGASSAVLAGFGRTTLVECSAGKFRPLKAETRV